jgi:hypothetical protein
MDRPRRPILSLRLKTQDRVETPDTDPDAIGAAQHRVFSHAEAKPPPRENHDPTRKRGRTHRIDPDLFRRATTAATSAIEQLLYEPDWRDLELHSAYQAAKAMAKPRHRIHAKLVATAALRKRADKFPRPEVLDLAAKAAYAAAMTVVVEDPDPR